MAAYGTERADTADHCGDTNNGFGLLWNWNKLTDGPHTMRLLVDGEEWATAMFHGDDAGRGVSARAGAYGEGVGLSGGGGGGDGGVAGSATELCGDGGGGVGVGDWGLGIRRSPRRSEGQVVKNPLLGGVPRQRRGGGGHAGRPGATHPGLRPPLPRGEKNGRWGRHSCLPFGPQSGRQECPAPQCTASFTLFSGRVETGIVCASILRTHP